MKKFYNKIYKKIYKNKKNKTKRSRYLYGGPIYRKLDELEKKKIKKAIKKYYPDVDSNSKVYKKISRDLAFSKEFYNCSTEDYFLFDFYHKSDKKRKEFITKSQKSQYVHLLNTDESITLLRDKYKTYKLLKDFYKRDVIELKDKKDYENFVSFTKKHKKFIKKTNNKASGKGIELIKVNEIDLKEFFNNAISGDNTTIIEEVINQAAEMASLHPTSVNTVRIITFLDNDGSVIIKYPFLRMGQNDSIVDNGGSGGILALVDEKTGIVKTNGVDESFKWYKEHPNTYVKIKGFEIPDWEDACNLAIEAQHKLPEARLIGWDLAYTNEGWILVEGNGHTMFIGQQIADQKGKKSEFEDMIHYDELIKKNK